MGHNSSYGPNPNHLRIMENGKGRIEIMSQGASDYPLDTVNVTQATEEIPRASSLSLRSYKSTKPGIIYEETDNLLPKTEQNRD